MSETGNPEATPVTTPVTQSATTPTNPPVMATAPAQAHSGRSPGQELLDAINALPERIVNGLREATPKPPKPVTQQTTETKPAEVKPENTVPQKKTLVQYWFG